MPRVLCVLNRLIIGGPALIAAYLTRYMSPEFETLMVIGGKDDHEQDATFLTDSLGIVPVVIPEMRRSIHPANDRKAYIKLKALIRDFQPDIVHTHAAKSGTIGRLAAFSCKVPVVVHTFHGHVFHSYFSKWKTNAFIQIERYLAARSTGIIAISETQKEELTKTYRICPEEKMRIIPLGLDLGRFQEDLERKRRAFRTRFMISDEELAIGIIGRIVPVKNHSLFVAAAERVIRQTDRKVRFVVVGDGDMRLQMEAEFRVAGIDYAYFPEEERAATAICISWQTNMDEVLAGLDVVALTSHNEGTPVSLIEAMAAGRPAVSTDVGGVSDVVLHGTTGLISEPGNADAFAASLVALAENTQLREAFGRDGLHHAQQVFSYQRMVQDTSNYYYELLEQVKSPAARKSPIL